MRALLSTAAQPNAGAARAGGVGPAGAGGGGGAPRQHHHRQHNKRLHHHRTAATTTATALASSHRLWRLVGGVGANGGGGGTPRRDATTAATLGGGFGRAGLGTATAASAAASRGFAVDGAADNIKLVHAHASFSKSGGGCVRMMGTTTTTTKTKSKRVLVPPLNARHVNLGSGVGFGSGPLFEVPDDANEGKGVEGSSPRFVIPAVGADTIVLGIETSCDDTGAAVVTGDGRVLGRAGTGKGGRGRERIRGERE